MLLHRYYTNLDRLLLSEERRPLDLSRHTLPLVVIPLARWDQISRNGVAYALRISSDVTALHCFDLEGPDAEQHATQIRDEWRRYVERPAREAGLPTPILLVQSSPYRSVLAPLLRWIREARQLHPDRPIAVVLPQLIEARWWERLLHTNRERSLHAALLRQAGRNIAFIGVPWQLDPPRPAVAVAQADDVPATAKPAAVSPSR